MPHRDEPPAGAPCWIDLYTSDPDGARTFYEQLFGWTSTDAGEEYGHYINFSMDGIPVAGGMGNDGVQGMPDTWTVYLATDDAGKTAETAAANGGQVHLPVMPIGELGKMAMVADPGQAAIGIWQPGLHKGFGIHGELNTPGWFELQTRDYDASVQFYRDVFHWDTHAASDSPEFRYTTLGQGDAQEAGIMDCSSYLPEGEAAKWSIYFKVEDADATLAKIVGLGGSIVKPAEDTPYGRLAEAADTTGTSFKLLA